MTSYSQASQDRFVAEVTANQRAGSFLDIGSNNPVAINNSYMLESELGWRGLLVDNSVESMKACEEKRKSAFLLTNAAAPQDWIGALRQAEEINHGVSLHPPRYVDYLSADIDGATLEFLKNFPFKEIKFRVMTIETDVYRNGLEYRDTMRRIIFDHGYELVAGDVKDQGLPFEDWWIFPDLVDAKLVARFKSHGNEWRDFWK